MPGFPATPLQDRFWKFVDPSAGPSACWPWTGARLSSGYGTFTWGPMSARRSTSAHRVAFALTISDLSLLDAGRRVVVMHSCDNPQCCNPAHLSVGTSANNAQDCVQKGRKAKAHAWAPRTRKYSDADVRLVRQLYDHRAAQNPTNLAALLAHDFFRATGRKISDVYAIRLGRRQVKTHVEDT